jgi:hypothetical protein
MISENKILVVKQKEREGYITSNWILEEEAVAS